MVSPASLKEPFSKEELHTVLLGLGGEEVDKALRPNGLLWWFGNLGTLCGEE